MVSFTRRTFVVLLLLLGAYFPALWPQTTPVIAVDHGPNAPQQAAKHYVVMVSLDGFRYDYAKKYGATHLLALAAEGASAPQGMIPSYPSITFPNHYTLVTGLYPEHHGIVAMTFYDPARKQTYSYRDPKTNSDGSWYGGVPLWSLAEKQGMRSACFFWPGSEAEIAGERPSYYLHFDDAYPDEKRIDQVIAWLKLPPEQRPHFITLYYSNVDHAGHEYGPDAAQTRAAVKHVDVLIGKLKADLDRLHLPVDLIVVSDHGMEKTSGGWIDLDKYVPLDGFTTEGSLLYAPSETAANHVYQKLKAADASFMVYRREHVPAELHYDENPREGDPVIVPRGPNAIRAKAPAAGNEDRPPNAGSHGYDPYMMPTMKAIFYAAGPDIRRGVTVKPFENVNVYPLVVQILGLESPKVDGSLGVLSGVLADPPADH
ncbi:ectonucleotide pyrophosphatase/phosphodiesterase [Paracidobacterium acidisoli]|uniref:Alkaline phosphatase family protein n=1 Tax=Paracidobacterium acidisoli TaxID=2303751 RepID=A0A372IRQ9_9BACT|nr:ectonucleotide pyrophosphatase/phosphodiesterase [Paracidobacterium acidisoli]MBT9330512.1 ectonucleotide pyrophosphatase/phosphodiesterase [Paracidobacterium acidisoli]